MLLRRLVAAEARVLKVIHITESVLVDKMAGVGLSQLMVSGVGLSQQIVWELVLLPRAMLENKFAE